MPSHVAPCQVGPASTLYSYWPGPPYFRPLTSDGIFPTSIGQARPQPLLRLSSHLASLGQPPSLPLVNPIFILASSSLLLANLSPLSARPLAVFHTSLGHAASWTESKYGGPCQLPIGPCQAILTAQPCQPDSGATLVYISASRCS